MANKVCHCIVLVLVLSVGSAFGARVIGFPPGANPIEENPVSGESIYHYIAPSGNVHGEDKVDGALRIFLDHNRRFAAYRSGVRGENPIEEDPIPIGFGFTGSKHEVPSGGDPINNPVPPAGGD
ncbi:uncharacterized protein A4U43_C09F13940 [Asparagus officinalis]|uniref:Uncharacterized protein n=1 Tax=Asparagus officinalis TaxID=4686 RepID=A0A5P1E787_ASPOF|nr:uncharacterized protein A4U43_C09F13940 [Asparagus officinalis]